jgi:hypothetical protein
MRKAAIVLLMAAALASACVSPQARRGQRLFAGCPDGVNDRASLAKGEFVCRGRPDPAPFAGNGRACGSCHMPGDQFGISVGRIAVLQPSHPFFFAGIDEDQELLRTHGLVHVVDGDEDGLNEFRPTPKLVHLQVLCNAVSGKCDALGLLGDRETDLCQFSREAVANHLAKTVARVPGIDFMLPTDEECDALVAYMLSNLVADQKKK